MTFMHYELEELVDKAHELREIETVISFGSLVYRLKGLEKKMGRKGYGAEVALRCLFLQFYYDMSDRALERQIRDSLGLRWFCGFQIDDRTPDHSYFGRIRDEIGAKGISKIFNTLVKKARNKNIIREMFAFVDATKVVAKNNTWRERDKALAEGEEKLNNDNIGTYSADPDARFGCKGKDKFWYGYKEHCSVDMSSMLITKIAVTPANIPDEQGFKHICPRNGEMTFGDKSYCLKPAQLEMQRRGCYSAAILKNNMKEKNRDLDRWRSARRAPFEGIFSKFEKRARYRSLAKVQLQAFMDAMVWNVKRLVTIHSPPLFSEA